MDGNLFSFLMGNAQAANEQLGSMERIFSEFSDTNEDGNIVPGKIFPLLPEILTDELASTGKTMFHKTFFHSHLYKEFLYQFIFGIIFSIPKSHPEKNFQFQIKDIYYRVIDDNIRTFVLHCKSKNPNEITAIHMHSFFFGKVAKKPSRAGQYTGSIANDEHFVENFDSLVRGMTKEEYQSIKSTMQDQYGMDNLKDISVRTFEYELFPKNHIMDEDEFEVVQREYEDMVGVAVNLVSNSKEVHGLQEHDRFVSNLRNEPLNNLEVDFSTGEENGNTIKLWHVQTTEEHLDFIPKRKLRFGQSLSTEELRKFTEETFLLYKATNDLQDGWLKKDQIIPNFKTSRAAMCGFLHSVMLMAEKKITSASATAAYEPKPENIEGCLYVLVEGVNIIDFSASDERATLGYKWVKKVAAAIPQPITYMRPTSINEDLTTGKMENDVTSKTSSLEFTFSNILQNFIDRVLQQESEADVSNLQLAIHEYFDLLISTSKSHKLSHDENSDADDSFNLHEMKYFLLGALKTTKRCGDSSHDVPENFVQVGRTDHGKDFNKIFINFNDERGTKLLFDFGNKESEPDDVAAEGVKTLQEPGNIIILKVGSTTTNKDKVMITYTIENQLPENLKFEPIKNIHIESLFDALSNQQQDADAVRIFTESMSLILSETLSFGTNDNAAMGAYIKGLFSHYERKIVENIENAEELSRRIQIDFFSNLRLDYTLALNIKLRKSDALNDAEVALRDARLLSSYKRQLGFDDSMTVVYNQLSETLTIAAGESQNERFNTENVQKFCKRGTRRKREFGGNLCSYTQEEDDKAYGENPEEKVDYEKIDESLMKAPEFSEFRNHITNLYEASGKMQLAFIGRDALADAVHKDIKGLARDSLFFGGAVASQKIGTKVAERGATMVENRMKLAGHAVTSVGKCLPKIGFDIYMGYQMYQDIKSNDTTGALMNGAMIGIDMVECGLEALAAFGVISLTPVVGQIALIATTIILVAVNIYEAVKKVENINGLVKLDFDEMEVESIYAFLHLNPESKISRLMDEVQANELIMKQVLENNPNYKRFVVNSAIINNDKSISVLPDNIAVLNCTVEMSKISRAMPREGTMRKANTRMFCFMDQREDPSESSFSDNFIKMILRLGIFQNTADFAQTLMKGPTPSQHYAYPCRNAFGFERISATLEDSTLFLLGDGNDAVIGFSEYTNVFSIGNGVKYIIGGNYTDKFVLHGKQMNGYLDGGSGENVLDLRSYAMSDLVTIKGNTVQLFGKKGVLRTKNINIIVGRKDVQDYMACYDCSHRQINLQGGKDRTFPDKILIPSTSCPYNLTITLTGYSYVHNQGQKGITRYILTPTINETLISIDSVGMQNLINFPNDKLSAVEIMVFKLDLNRLVVSILTLNKSLFAVKLPFNSNTTFIFQDAVSMVWNDEGLVATLTSYKTVLEIVDEYTDFVAKNSMVTIFAHSKTENQTILFDNNGIKVKGDRPDQEKRINLIRNNFHHSINLVGHPKQENYFLVTIPKKLNSIDDYKIPEVKIHCSKCVSTNYIDLHMMAEQLYKLYSLELLVSPGITSKSKHRDIFLKLYIQNTSSIDNEIKFIGQIVIVNAFENNLYQNFKIFIYGENKFIKTLPNNLNLLPAHININNSVQLITPGQIDRNVRLVLTQSNDSISDIHSLDFYKMEKSLVITNVDQGNYPNKRFLTLIFIDYDQYVTKYETVFIGWDKHFTQMKSLAGRIRLAPNIKSMWTKIAKIVKKVVQDTEK